MKTEITSLEEIELRCTQARLASSLTKKSKQVDFLLGELKRIAEYAREAISKATGK